MKKDWSVAVLFVLFATVLGVACNSSPAPVSQMNVQVGTTPGPNASIFSNQSFLCGETSEGYIGRVVVEIWDKTNTWTFAPVDSNDHSYLLARSLLVLQNPDPSSFRSSTPWSNEPAIGTQTDQAFQGRVVIEVCNGEEAVIAISGIGDKSNLIKQSIEVIEENK